MARRLKSRRQVLQQTGEVSTSVLPSRGYLASDAIFLTWGPMYVTQVVHCTTSEALFMEKSTTIPLVTVLWTTLNI